ncbi:MAG: methyltransferase domain-containing protein [Candidatus Paceibacterota bacterium]|jgi:SAM-dependent methyltransferase
MNESLTPKKLNLGSGEHRKPGYINVDWQELTKPDVVHNLNVLPYPFSENTFDFVEAFHVLEHLDKPFLVMKELHRITKPGGTVTIKVPHFSRGFTHAEHAHGFDVTFPLYFNPAFTTSGYFGVPFELKKMKLHWLAFFHLMPTMGYGKIIILILRGVNGFISFLANISPAFTSRIWCFWVGGFDEIEFQFKCVK